MVMELMEGETLAARIKKGPIPLEQALSFAARIADALDRAHRVGVTHRDVMPAIVKALIGSFRGIVITMCFPWRFTTKPHFARTRTAWRCFTPASLGIN